ncbi:MAG: PKD domain-containing protein, partial [Bacteroidetes bacterium]|nr:PKD domain-containing protein [Bacteroidota bacterium]
MNKVIFLILPLVCFLCLSACKKQPTADFNVSATTVTAGNPVDFTNKSEDAASYMWDFGDGQTSTAESPTHVYATAGNYTVTLTAYSEKEKKSDNAGKTIVVEPDYSITITTPNSLSEWNTETNYEITWTHTITTIAFVDIQLYKSDEYLATLAGYEEIDSSYTWYISACRATGSDYQIKLISVVGSDSITAFSDYFTINNPRYIEITSPATGDEWWIDSLWNIKWDSYLTGNVTIELYKGGIYNQSIATNVAPTGSYYWPVNSSMAAGSDYTVKIFSEAYNAIFDTTGFFRIVKNYSTLCSG